MDENKFEILDLEVERENISQKYEKQEIALDEKITNKIIACLKTWLATKSIHTQRSYKKTINDYLKTVGHRIFEVEPAIIIDWIFFQRLTPSSSALKLTTIRSMYDVLIVNSLTIRNPVVAIKSDCFGIVHKRHHKAVPQHEIIRALNSLDLNSLLEKDPLLKLKMIRDATILRLFANLGLRCSELSCLKVKDFKPNQGFITIRGKGGKIVEFPIKYKANDSLKEWLSLRVINSEFIFTSFASNSEGQQTSHLSTNGIRKIVRKYLGAEVESKISVGEDGKKKYEYKLVGGYTPHCLRSTSITECYHLSGKNLHLAQSHARHSSPVVTEQVYIATDKLNDAEMFQPNF